MTDIDDLEKKAREAKRAPWKIGAMESGMAAIDSFDDLEVTGFIDPEDAEFILAANPSAILDLIARCRKAEARVAELEEQVKHFEDRIYTNTNRKMTLEGRFFAVMGDDFISDENFDFDAGLRVTGDFVDDEKQRYAQMIACALNNAVTNQARVAELEAQSGEPVAWLFTGFKPGCRKEFASVDSSDSQTWPTDDGMKWDKRPLYLRAPQAVPEWQPIETAPKDGTRILLKGYGSTVVAGWGRIWEAETEGWCIVNDAWLPHDLAECWMPIPPKGENHG